MNRHSAFASGFLLLIIQPFTFAEPQRAVSGPWGNLRVTEIFVQQNREVIEQIPVPSSKTVWRFQNISTYNGILQFFDSILALRTDQELNHLRKLLALQEIPGVETRAFPKTEFILALTVPERIKIYRELAKNKGNPYHKKPVFIDSDSPATWFKGSELNTEAIDLIKKLSYPVGDSLAFSDVPLILETVATKEEEYAALQAMSRTRLLHLELELKQGTNIEALQKYWIPEYENQAGAPTFRSLTRPELLPYTIDLLEILPNLAKKRTGEFPAFIDGVAGAFPGAFWSSYNFFRSAPNEEDIDSDKIEDLLAEKYMEVEGPWRYGDLITFSSPQTGQIIHSCVYIADNIAFTKNDRSIMTPWTLMELKYIKARFSINQIPTTTGWRSKSGQLSITPFTNPQ